MVNKHTLRLLNSGQLFCYICGRLIENKKDYSRDHEPPRCRQKELGKSKIYHCCAECNHDKGALSLEEYRLFCRLRVLRNGGRAK